NRASTGTATTDACGLFGRGTQATSACVRSAARCAHAASTILRHTIAYGGNMVRGSAGAKEASRVDPTARRSYRAAAYTPLIVVSTTSAEIASVLRPTRRYGRVGMASPTATASAPNATASGARWERGTGP